MSEQVLLMEIAMGLKPGQAYDIPQEWMEKAAISDLPLLDRMGGARRDDILAFIAKVEPNWGVEFREKIGTRKWQMYRPTV